MWGWGYGGFVTSLAMSAPSVNQTFIAGASVAPITDWIFYGWWYSSSFSIKHWFKTIDSVFTERYMQTPQDNKQGYSSMSFFLNVIVLITLLTIQTRRCFCIKQRSQPETRILAGSRYRRSFNTSAKLRWAKSSKLQLHYTAGGHSLTYLCRCWSLLSLALVSSSIPTQVTHS